MSGNDILQRWRHKYTSSGSLDVGSLTYRGHPLHTDTLVSSASIVSICFGTGHSIYTNAIIPTIESATAEVIIVTCFWARSRPLDSLSQALIRLSEKHCASRQDKSDRIRVRICFSAASLLQKIFHTSSLAGHTYDSSQWTSKLGLPSRDRLPGLDVEIKSIFVLPFSVMHPKFILVDRMKVLLPSCNVSWEDWFEGCVEFHGPVVDRFVGFWKSFWASESEQDTVITTRLPNDRSAAEALQRALPRLLLSSEVNANDIPAVFLPSSHHRNPRFALPWQPCPPPPPTPLNTFVLTAFHNAKKDIYLQTPNLTAPPVLSALLAALTRGVNVDIVTSERLMILEQLFTAGTTTQRCVKKLMKRHRRLVHDYKHSLERDVESLTVVAPGALSVRFFAPMNNGTSNAEEPVQSHVKATIIDAEICVLGSGNMDRASWFTSQEMGVAFVSTDFAAKVRSQLDGLMQTRTNSALHT